MLSLMARNKSRLNAWTPNQIVAYRVAIARQLRGWTQDQAAEELAPFLGTKLSTASFSAIERSFAGGRVRQFNADEILALSRGFKLPIGWFFTPPAIEAEIGIETPDAKGIPWSPMLMIDAILGDDDTLPPWIEQLRIWALGPTRVVIDNEGKWHNLGPEHEDLYQRADIFVKSRTQLRIGELLGDTEKAKQVLEGLVELLGEIEAGMDESAPYGTKRDKDGGT